MFEIILIFYDPCRILQLSEFVWAKKYGIYKGEGINLPTI